MASEMTHLVTRPWTSLNWPNRISIIRLFLVAPFVVLLMNQRDVPWARHAALVIFAVMAASDLLDGQLARRLNLRTRLGAILDPLADKALIICSVFLLAMPESSVPGARLPSWLVVAVVGKDLWVVIGFIVLYLVTDKFRVRPSAAGKASTVAQLATVMSVLVSPDVNRLSDGLGTGIARFLCWTTAALCVAAVISYTRFGLSVVAEGQKPLEDPLTHPTCQGQEGRFPERPAQMRNGPEGQGRGE